VAHLVAAFDKFKGTASARSLTHAAVRAAESCGWTALGVPLADGGEGSLDCVGGANRWVDTTDALGGPVRAGWRLDGSDAFIEMAEAAGLARIGGADANDPIAASTRGVGELIRSALDEDASTVVVFLGGSATVDGGIGAVEVIASHPRISDVDLIAATDVTERFLEAPSVFGPQKGADETQVAHLTDRLEATAAFYADRFGVDVRDVAGGGAAGGLGGGLVALGGRVVPGFDVVAAAVGLDPALVDADLVVTGEGRLDAASFHGKVVGSVWARARDHGTPVVAIVGSCERDFEPPAGLSIACLSERFGSAASLADAPRLVARVTRDLLER
jgi:glycerate kinase